MIREFIICPQCQEPATVNTFMFTEDHCIDCHWKTNLGQKARDRSDQQQSNNEEGSAKLPLPAPILG